MSADNENKNGGCDCGSGGCCGGAKPAGRSQVVRFISLAVIVVAATLLIVRGMTRNANCAPGACSVAAGKGCCLAASK